MIGLPVARWSQGGGDWQTAARSSVSVIRSGESVVNPYGLYQPSVLEMARAGNFQAIAYWLNGYLAPHGIQAYVGPVRPGCLQIFVEFQPLSRPRAFYVQLRDRLVRFICSRIWKLNSEAIYAVRIVACCAGDPQILWRQSIRIITPANRRRRRVYRLSGQRRREGDRRLKIARALLLCGSTVSIFVFACVLTLQSLTTGWLMDNDEGLSGPDQTETVQTPLETVAVTARTGAKGWPNRTVTLLFAGDVHADMGTAAPSKPPRATAKLLETTRQADLLSVSLENWPAEGIGAGTLASEARIQPLAEAGVDIVNLANYQVQQLDRSDLQAAIEALEQSDAKPIGAGRNRVEARRPEIIDIQGQRIAYLDYAKGGLREATHDGVGINPWYGRSIAEDIRAIRPQVDWVIVNYHWGETLSEEPEAWQVNLARFTIDQGADVVVGYHPETLQGGEVYKGRPIAYSMGEFAFGRGSETRADYETAMLKVSLKQKQMKVEYVPVRVENSQPRLAKGGEARRILEKLSQNSQNFAQPLTGPLLLETRSPAEPNKPLTAPTAPLQPAFSSPQAPPEAQQDHETGVAPGDRDVSAETLESLEPTFSNETLPAFTDEGIDPMSETADEGYGAIAQ